MNYYSMAALAAAWSSDQHGSFALEDGPNGHPVLWDEVPPAWGPFVAGMQVLGNDHEQAGWVQFNAVVTHYSLGTYAVGWSSHLEGRGPCFVQLLQLGERGAQAVSVPGPLEGGQPGTLLGALMAQGGWHCWHELPGVPQVDLYAQPE